MSMRVKFYHGDDYLYGVLADDEYEYMTYAEYLMLRDGVGGFAVLPSKTSIDGGKLDVCVYTGVRRVEKINDSVFAIKISDHWLFVDGLFRVRVDDGLYMALKQYFSDDFRVVGMGIHGLGDGALWSNNRLIIVESEKPVDYDVRDGVFLLGSVEKSFLIVIDFNKVPTVERVYEVVEGGETRFLGSRYKNDVSFLPTKLLSGHCETAAVWGMDTVVRVGGGGVKVIGKVRRKVGKDKRNKDFPFSGKFEFVFGPRVVKEDKDFFVVGIVKYGDGFYYLKGPYNYVAYGDPKRVVEYFGRRLPLVEVASAGNKLRFVPGDPVDYSGDKKRRYEIFGHVFEDNGYFLGAVVRGKLIVAPLVRVEGDKKYYILTLPTVHFLMGNDVRGLVNFIILRNEVIPFYEERGVPLYRNNYLSFRGYIVPREPIIEDFIKFFGDRVRGVEYLPGTDGYTVVFDMGAFKVNYAERGYFYIEFGDVMAVVTPQLEVESFFFREGERFEHFYERSSYFLIEVGNDVIVKFMKAGKEKKGVDSRVRLPVIRPKYVYVSCGVWVSIRGRPIVKLFDLCLPESVKVLSIGKDGGDDAFDVDVCVGGEVVKIFIDEDGDSFWVAKDNRVLRFESISELEAFLHVMKEFGFRGAMEIL